MKAALPAAMPLTAIIEKNSGAAEGGVVGKLPVKLTAGTAAEIPPAARSVSALVAAAALPADTLSESIVLFARFFSLPLKPQSLAEIRRQTVQVAAAEHSAEPMTEKTASAETAAKSREALALAAAAAGSKGVELSPESLESYAAAVDPRGRERGNSGGRRGQKHNQKEPGNDKNASVIPVFAARDLNMETILAAAEKDPLLDILNRLPGKNGRRWMVFPFNFTSGKKNFHACLKILIEKEKAAESGDAALMCLDIAEGGGENGGVERDWLFVLEPGTCGRLAVYMNPPPRSPRLFIRALSRASGIPFDRITVRRRGEYFPFEAEQGRSLLRSVNKTV